MKLNASRLRELREKNGLTQTALSKKIRKHVSTVSLLESGRIQGLPPTIKKISEVLGVSIEYLLEEEPAQPSNAE